MTPYKKAQDTLSIVVVGSFNPGIFHPQWFLRHELVAEPDMDDSMLELKVVHPEVAQFKTWFSIEVTHTRFMVSTSDLARAEDLRDLVCNIFNILSENPVTAIGINSTYAVACDTEEAWHKLGHTLAPKDIWLEAIPEAIKEPGGVGMKSIDIELRRWDELPGAVRVTVQPSKPPPSPEASFRINDHVNIEKLVEMNSSATIPDILLNHWEHFTTSPEKIVEGVLGRIYDGSN